MDRRQTTPARKEYAVPAPLSATITASKMTQMTSMTDNQTHNVTVFFTTYIGWWTDIHAKHTTCTRNKAGHFVHNRHAR